LIPPPRQLLPSDIPAALEIYRDAVLTQAPGLYSPEQVQAWASLALLPGVLDEPLQKGYGLISEGPEGAAAFAVLHPPQRIALLYCRGWACRQGRGRQLLQSLESEACRRGCSELRSEASQLSRPLFLKLGWEQLGAEQILIAGIPFERYRMRKVPLRLHERLEVTATDSP
jgi:L-amino acid N-acyltransferase YncA